MGQFVSVEVIEWDYFEFQSDYVSMSRPRINTALYLCMLFLGDILSHSLELQIFMKFHET